MIKEYQQPDTKKALMQIANSFLPFIAIWVLMYFSLSWSYWITFVLGIINCFFLVRIFIIQHDCGHHSFLKSAKWNDTVGVICSLFTSIPYKYWARLHNFHHGHSGQLEFRDMGDINFWTVNEFRNAPWWKKAFYRFFRMPVVLFFVAPLAYLTISNRFPLMNIKGWRKTQWSQVYNNLLIAAVYIPLAFLLGWKAFLIVQATCVLMFGVVAFWFFYVQHQHEEAYKQWRKNWDYIIASVKGSTYYKLPKMFQWLTGNIGFHHIHHLSPRIPNYNLEKCAKDNPILQKYVTSVTFWQSLKYIFIKLWDEESQRMITFWEYYQIEKKRLKKV